MPCTPQWYILLINLAPGETNVAREVFSLLQLQIAPSSGLGSRMSLTQTSDEEGEGDDDDFGDTIFLLEDGETPSKRQRKAGGSVAVFVSKR